MAQKWSRQPGRWGMPGRLFAAGGSDAGFGSGAMRTRLPWLLVRPKTPSLWLGIAVAGFFIVFESIVVGSINVVTHHTTGGVGTIYLLGVVVVAALWGFGLAVTTSVVSAIVFLYFRSWPGGGFVLFSLQSELVIAVFVVIALVANALAGLARVGERFYDLSSDLLCITGPDRVIRVNPAFTRILGYSLDELESRPYIGLVVPEDQARVREALEQLAGSTEPVRLENRVICRDGSRRWIEWSIVWQRGLYYAVGRDVTERRREQDALHQAQAAMEASHDELGVLATHQTALRRVATLVARGVEPSEIFATVADEMARCLNAANASVNRFDGDTVTVLALARVEPRMEHKPVVGERHTLEGDNIATRVAHTGQPARLDGLELANAPGSIAARLREMGLRCTVAVPITVDERVWGMAAVGSSAPDPFPADTEARMGDFADLVATAISNAATRAELQDSRDELAVLADQQAALRQVATLVARGMAHSEVFSAVAVAMARCLRAGHAAIYRYADDALVPLAIFHNDGLQPLPKGLRLRLEGDNVVARVQSTGRAARIDRHDDAPVPHAGRMRGFGIDSAVGVPIIVDGQVWGAAIVGSLRPEPLPPDTEARMSDFADLVATAIANAATRSELIASRARIVAAADDARRRLERDLHDGAQQRLVSLGLQLRLAEGTVPSELQSLKEQLSGVVSGLTAVSSDLQQISRGIHPAILSAGGLGPALKTLARRCPIPVTLYVDVEPRLPDSVEITAYYVVAEALTNTAKYAQASHVNVSAETKDATLDLSIHDDGIGGADARKGSGLIGLKDRVEVLGGHMKITSPPECGTSLHITIPLAG